ncbi:MAG: diguanylate cyclase [Cyanobacteria bacterium RYN_339]|nr:diguanylate cyclase [Cyanobacteria bacterium RYN_339]
MSRRLTHRPSTTYAERLGQVHGLLDTLAEARLERITRTARRLFGVEGAAIILWRNGRVVYQAGSGTEHLPLERLMRHGGGPQVLEGPAGSTLAIAPLHVDLRLSGGCLCLYDADARALTTEDLQSLADLATWAEDELDVVRLGQTLALRMA